MSESCEPGKEPVSQTEENVTKDGKTRKIVKVRICKRDIALRAQSEKRAALSSLREARAELAQEKALSEATRARSSPTSTATSPASKRTRRRRPTSDGCRIDAARVGARVREGRDKTP